MHSLGATMYRLAMLALAAVLVACSGPKRTPASDLGAQRETQPQAEPQPQPPVKPPENPPAKAEPAKPADVKRGKLEDAEEPEQKRALAIIEKVTGRKFKNAIPVYVYTPEELAEEMKEWGGDFVPENVMGFYKPTTKAFYLVPKVAGNKRSFGLRVHEATHALQDQHFDLIKLHESVKTSDQDNSLTALIEGEAVQVMIDGLSDLSPHVAKIAEVTVPTDKNNPNAWYTVFYYAMGAKFVQALKVKGGYEEVAKAFTNLPKSTEQILHPEKYTTTVELPQVVTADSDAITAALPAGWKLSNTNTLGEWETRMLFVAKEKTYESAASLAEGWGGDVELTFTQADKKDAWLKLWMTSWDTQADADAVFAALAELTDVKYKVQAGKLISVLRSSEALTDEQSASLAKAMAKAKVE